jgi:hypothetical protein
MTDLTAANLAETIAELKDEANLIAAEYKVKTEKLIDLVGEEGETFRTPLGSVQVTQKTEDRLGDGYNLVFNREVYDALDTVNQQALIELGVVKLERAVIKGQAPKVVVRLS